MKRLFLLLLLLNACSRPNIWNVAPQTQASRPLHSIALNAGSAYPRADFVIAPARVNLPYALANARFIMHHQRALAAKRPAPAAKPAPKKALAAAPAVPVTPAVTPKTEALPEISKPSASPRANAIIATAKKQLGVPYRFGGTQPNTGFDCSGLMVHIHQQHGIPLPRSSSEQFARLPVIAKPRVGDLVFFRHGKNISHVGLYLGEQRMLHAPRRGRTVSIERIDKPYWQKRYAGARRVL